MASAMPGDVAAAGGSSNFGSGLGWLGPVASIAGKFFDYSNAKDASEAARRDARNAFKNRIQDAHKFGIHPLAAIGAGGISGGPAVGAFSDFGSMGQDVSRAVAATGNVDERVQGLTLRNLELRNSLIEAQIGRLQKDQVGPAIPFPTSAGGVIAGQGDSPADFSADPRVAMVKPPSPAVETAKFFGYPLIRNPRIFSSAQTGQNEFGEWWENIAGIPAAMEAFSRAILQQNLRDYERGRRIQKEYR